MSYHRSVNVVIGLVVNFEKKVEVTEHLRTMYDQNSGQPYMSSQKTQTVSYVLNGKNYTSQERQEFIEGLMCIEDFEYYSDEYSDDVFGISISELSESSVFVLKDFDQLDYAETFEQVKKVAEENGLDSSEIGLIVVSKMN